MKRKILVVDDKKDIVEIISLILQKNGYDVEKAYTGKKCLKILEQQPVMGIFLDIMMPEMSGYKIAKKIKQKYSKDIKIVFVTVKSNEEVNMEYGDYLIRKPFGITQILNGAKLMEKNVQKS